MEETMRLIRLAHTGDTAARERLVMENEGLVWSIVRRFTNRGCELEDLYQIGCIGLLKAIDKFDLSFQVHFSTYAVPMIAGEIRRFLRDDGIIKVSRSIRELGMRVRAERDRLTQELGREPGIGEIASRLSVSPEQVAASLEAAAEVESIYKPIGDEEQSLCLADRIFSEGEEEAVVDRLTLEALLKRLSGRERELVILRYFEDQTQTTIAKRLKISQVQVSRMEKKILSQLREYLE